jgi:hypothetical protein
MRHHKTPADAIKAQEALIAEAIAKLTEQLDSLHATIDPTTANWSHVGAFAQAADAAVYVIKFLEG